MTPKEKPILAWGKRVSPLFRKRAREVAKRLGVHPSDLMACMAFESAYSFRSDIQNPKSGATGLIQFMPSTLAAMGLTVGDIITQTPEDQLLVVELYFEPWKRRGLKTLSDLYMAILWPAGIGKPEDHVLFTKSNQRRPKLYLQNHGLDFNKDGTITKAEAAACVAAALKRGLKPANVHIGDG